MSNSGLVESSRHIFLLLVHGFFHPSKPENYSGIQNVADPGEMEKPITTYQKYDGRSSRRPVLGLGHSRLLGRCIHGMAPVSGPQWVPEPVPGAGLERGAGMRASPATSRSQKSNKTELPQRSRF